MTPIYPNLFIGTVDEIPYLREGLVVVNVASTHHYKIHGWNKGMKDHPCYIVCTDHPDFISVNWVDGPAMLYDYQGRGVERFKMILDFIDHNIKTHKVLITCNQAISRSPAIALLYLAKYAHKIPDATYMQAKEEFMKIYPKYQPGGIEQFITEHWDEI